MKDYLVTGGLGFIGSHLVQALLRLTNTRVWIVDDGENASWNPRKGRVDYNDKVRDLLVQIMGGYEVEDDNKNPELICISGDCAHKNILDRIRAGHFQGVFHLAANVSVAKSIEEPIVTLDQNVKKTLLIAKACADGQTRLVFSSSAAVYGNVEGKASECYKSVPTNPYGLSKATSEDWFQVYGALYNLDWVSLRYFNVYGPRQLGGSPYSGVVGNWIHNLWYNKPITIYGTGQQTRDFVYVEDVALANIKAMQSKNTGYKIFNVCTGKNISLNNLQSLITGDKEHKIIKEPARSGEVDHSIGDSFNASHILGWAPKIDITEGIELTKSWRGL